MFNNYLIASLAGLLIFFFSFDFTNFNGYNLVLFTGIFIFLFFYIWEVIYLFRHQTSIKMIIVISIIMAIAGAMVFSGVYVWENKKKIDSNWPQYKCKPYVIPLAGILVGPSNTNPTETFIDCMWSINQTFFGILISPFLDILGLLMDVLKGLTTDVQNLRKLATFMRDNMREIARDTYQKIYDSYSRIAFLFKTVMRVLYKLFDVFDNVFDVMLYAFYTTASIWNGPIGGIVNFFCFDEKTPIKLKDGRIEEIRFIMPGDKLADGSKVIASMEFLAKDTKYNIPMYTYQGITVSGNHMVFNGNKWQYVKYCEDAKLYQNYNKKRIYCLVTDTGEITVNNIKFKDYWETNDRDLKIKMYKVVQNYLNMKMIYPIEQILLHPSDHMYESGFSANTKIELSNGELRRIRNIEIGDETINGKIIGKVQIRDKKVKMYKYNDIIVSGTTLVMENYKWIPIYKSNKIEEVVFSNNIYNIFTEEGKININGNIFRDYEQENSKELNEYINKEIYFQSNS